MKDWEKTLVGPEMSVREVITRLNSHAAQIALVADESRVLLGVVTDGDIRRAFLKGLTLEAKASQVMNSQFKSASTKETAQKIVNRMVRGVIRHMPVVDEQKRVVGLKVLDELLQPAEKENAVVLMAGGMGKRLGPLTENCPKPMLRVGNKPVLEIILDNFLRHGFRRFYISVNYKAEMVEEHFGDGSQWGAQIVYLREKERLGTAGSLSLLPEKPKLPFIVMNGDLLTNVNLQQLLQFHEDQKAQATMCVREHAIQVPYGVVNIGGNQILNVDEKPTQKFFVNAGIYVLNPSTLDLIPQGQYFDMPSLFDRLIEQKLQTAAFPIREYWLDIGQRTDFERALSDYSGEFEEEEE